MKKARCIPLHVGIPLIFAALVFSYFATNHDRSARLDEQSVQPIESAPERSTVGFVPGGIQLPPAPGLQALDQEAVLGGERIPQSLEGITKDKIHVRSRALSLAQGLELLPPPVGREHEAAREFVFELFDDVRLVGSVERLERHNDERVVYYGSLVNVPEGDFIIAYNEGHVAATFHTPNMGSYQLRPLGKGMVAAIEVDLTRLPPCQAKFPESVAGGLPDLTPTEIRAMASIHAYHAASAPVEGGVFGGTGQQGGSGADLAFTTLDVLIVHTANATASAGGLLGMVAVLDMAVARANSVLINSDVGLRLQMVRREEVAYNEINTETSLNALTDGTGAFSSVPTWRNESGADVISLIFDGGGGLAWIYNGNNAYAYSVSGLAGIEGTFIHEIGHNLGCLHDRGNNETPPAYSYGYGWRFTPDGSGEVRTIMAYAPGSAIPYFSNPDVTYMGTPTGVPIGAESESNNAEAIRQTMAHVTAFRAENGNVPPSVVLQSPSYHDPFKALDSVNLIASASDSDGTVEEVRFYRLMEDSDLDFSNTISTTLGSDNSPPYAVTEQSAPAGFWTYAAVARDNSGAIGVDTVSIAVAPHYRRTILPLPEGKSEAEIEGINESGRIVGFGHSGDSAATDVQAAYWEDGAITLLNPLVGDTGARALAIGQDGVIYGESISDGAIRRAVRWVHGTTAEDISGVVGEFTAQRALGVDELGRIYLGQGGTSFRRFNNPGSTTPGTNERWEKVANTGLFATGHDYDSGPQAWRALRWNNGGTRLAPVAGFSSSWGEATNRTGAVFGFSSPSPSGWSSDTSRLTFWPAGSTTPIDLGNLGLDGGLACDLNDWNHAVGAARDPQKGLSAIIWKGEGALIELDDVVLPSPGFKYDARVINNRGQIAGRGINDLDHFIYFLDPLPGLDTRYWLASHFTPAELENTSLTGDQATPSGDGIANLTKRAFGLDPRVAATPGDLEKLPDGEIDDDGHFHFRFRRLRAPRDIEYTPQMSFTMAVEDWTGDLLEHVGTTFLDDEFEEVRLRTAFPADEENKAFIRLRLSR